MEFFEHLLRSTPLEVFVFIGTLIDEIISPIPAFLILVPAGIAAQIQQIPLWYLVVLAIISGVARTIGGYILYILADKIEAALFSKGRKFFGTSHSEIKKLGDKLSTQKASKSWFALFFMHAMPIFPGIILSAGSGFIKIGTQLFITSTLAGSTVSAFFFLYLGYSGIQVADVIRRLDVVSQIVTVTFIIILGYLIFRYQKSMRKNK